MRSVALREVYLSKWGVFKSCRPIFFSPCQIEMKLLQESTGKMRELERLGLALDKKGTMFVCMYYNSCLVILKYDLNLEVRTVHITLHIFLYSGSGQRSI